jgi:hypothetical protein
MVGAGAPLMGDVILPAFRLGYCLSPERAMSVRKCLRSMPAAGWMATR